MFQEVMPHTLTFESSPFRKKIIKIGEKIPQFINVLKKYGNMCFNFRLILMWYNPVTDACGKLRHILGAFFPLFASLSIENQNTIEEAFLPTLKTLFSAPVTSPLNEVDIEDVGLFLLQLTDRGFLQGHEGQKGQNKGHDNVAYALCNHIISDPMSFHVKLLLKLLTTLQLSVDDFSMLKELKVMQGQMAGLVKDKLNLKTVEKFGKTLDLYLAQNPEKATEGQKVDEVQKVNEGQNEETLNNTTKLFRKRPLFSQTLNMLEEGHEVEAEKPLAALVEDQDDDDDLFATPKAARTLHNVEGELEITKVEESPLSSLDTTEDEIVAGNLASMAKKKTKKANNEDSVITSTQVESRRSSKRLSKVSNSSEEKARKKASASSEEEFEDSPKPTRRPPRGKASTSSEDKKTTKKNALISSEEEFEDSPKATRRPARGKASVSSEDEGKTSKARKKATKASISSEEESEDTPKAKALASSEDEVEDTPKATKRKGKATKASISSEDDEEVAPKATKRSVKGKAIISEPSRPQRKSRRLDSSTGSSDSSTKVRPKKSKKA